MHYLPDAAIFIFLIVLLVLLGWWCAEPRRTKLENTLLLPSACLGAYALLIWIRGLFLNRLYFDPWPLFFFLLLPPTVAFAQRPPNVAAHARAAFNQLITLRGLDLALTLYLVAVFGLTFVLTLAPPSGNDYDSLTYHLGAPGQYLRMNAVRELPYDHHTYFPLTVEMLYMAGLWLRGPVLAKLFHWWMLPLSCGVLVAMGQRHLSLRAGLLAAALFASLPVVLAEASTAYIDLGLTAFALLAFLCFANWLASGDRWWLAWCGVFCGFCLGIKYLGALIFGWLLLWAIARQVTWRRFESRAMTLFVFWALLLGSGWYLRNWSWTGNPVFPFAYEVFGGKGWTLEMARAYTKSQLEYGFGRSPLDWLWLPWRVSMTPVNAITPYWPFNPATIDPAVTAGLFETKGHFFQGLIGPALLAFGAPLIFVKRKPPIIGLALWSFLFFWIFWGLTGQYLRYLIPPFAMLCLACGWSINLYLQRSAILKWSTGVALCAWLIFAPAYTLSKANENKILPVIMGQETPEAYLLRTFSGYEAMRWASTSTPANARFAVYGEARCFYLKRDYFWADDPHNNLIDYAKVRSGADLVQQLKQIGTTHVLWNQRAGENGGVFGPPEQINEAIDKALLVRLFEARGYAVYRIADVAGTVSDLDTANGANR